MPPTPLAHTRSTCEREDVSHRGRFLHLRAEDKRRVKDVCFIFAGGILTKSILPQLLLRLLLFPVFCIIEALPKVGKRLRLASHEGRKVRGRNFALWGRGTKSRRDNVVVGLPSFLPDPPEPSLPSDEA